MVYVVLREEPSPTRFRVRVLRFLADTKQAAVEHITDGDELWFVEGARWQQLSPDIEASAQTAAGQLYLF